MVCSRLVLLIAALGVVSTVWADDPCAPPWRGDPGTTMSEWNYSAAPPITWADYPRVAPPDTGIVIPHPEKGEPGNFVGRAYDEGWLWDGPHWSDEGFWVDPLPFPESHYETHAMQLWGSYSWLPTFAGRTGVLDFGAGSWDIYNFWSMQPAKDIWIQLTWMPMTRGATVDFHAELEYFTLEPLMWTHTWTGWWLCPAGWGYPCSWDGFWEYGWIGSDEPVQHILEWWDEYLVPFEEISLEGNWVLSKFLIEIQPNPVNEFFSLFPSSSIVIDQIVIDTICYVPEPATIALLGVGVFFLLKRRR